jgi:hypothetical protein
VTVPVDVQPLDDVAPSAVLEDVVTVARGNEVVVWIFGGDGRSTWAALRSIGRDAPPFARRLTIEGAHVTGCSSMLMQFITRMTHCMPVTVRRPTPLLRQNLVRAGLAGCLRVRDRQDQL